MTAAPDLLKLRRLHIWNDSGVIHYSPNWKEKTGDIRRVLVHAENSRLDRLVQWELTSIPADVLAEIQNFVDADMRGEVSE